MIRTTRTRIKVCCIGSAAEARLAVRYGADALGLVSAMPSGPGPIPEPLIAEIAAAVPPPVATFLLTCEPIAAAVIAQHARCRTTTLQLVDRLEAGTLADLNAALPGVTVVQVVHVNGPDAVDEARRAADAGADAVLLDSGDQRLAVKLLGGTGRVHDWTVSRKVVEAVPVPVFLAGGLTPGNAAEAVREVGPFGLDVCSGLRTDGRLDEGKLAAFMAAVRAAAG